MEKRLDHDAIREYYKSGHTRKQTAEKFNTTSNYVKKLCKGIKRNKTNEFLKREANAIQCIEKFAPSFEYVGDFTNVDGFVDVRCKVCGEVIHKSFVSIRKGQARCSNCYEREVKEQREKKYRLKEADLKLSRMQKDYNRIKRISYQEKMEQCKCCGDLFLPKRKGVQYCSDECSKRINNAVSKDKRIKKIRHIIVDSNITLKRLYERDEGKCAICGNICDWNDYTLRTDGTFIALDNYPSIDHIQPISKGGLHAWDNIQLACRKCNTKKGARLIAPYAKPA